MEPTLPDWMKNIPDNFKDIDSLQKEMTVVDLALAAEVGNLHPVVVRLLKKVQSNRYLSQGWFFASLNQEEAFDLFKIFLDEGNGVGPNKMWAFEAIRRAQGMTELTKYTVEEFIEINDNLIAYVGLTGICLQNYLKPHYYLFDIFDSSSKPFGNKTIKEHIACIKRNSSAYKEFVIDDENNRKKPWEKDPTKK